MSNEASKPEGGDLPPINPGMIETEVETDLGAFEAGKTPDEIAEMRLYLRNLARRQCTEDEEGSADE